MYDSYLLLEIFTDLTSHLEFLFKLLELIIVILSVLQSIIGKGLRRGDEVEERLCGETLTHKTTAVGVYRNQ